MKRTYNIFVDNGLYVASYYIDKPIKDITVTDIKESIDMIIEQIAKHVHKNPKLTWMAFANSSLANSLKFQLNIEDTQAYIKKQFNTILDNIGTEERCSICGEKHIMRMPDKKYTSMLARCLMPMLPANTFYNYSNNLQIVNVCPVCIILCMISLLNMQKARYAILYNSDNNEFMIDYTKERQEFNNSNNTDDTEKEKSTTDYIIEQIEWFIEQDRIHKGYISVAIFNNSGQSVSYDDGFISQKEINMLKEMQKKGLYEEFKQLHLFNLMLYKKLNKRYLDYLIDYKNETLKSSEELFYYIDSEVSILNEEMLELIKTVCLKIKQAEIKNYIQDLKNVVDASKFEDLLLTWQEEYKNKTGGDLFPNGINDYHNLCNYKLNQSIKKRMLSQFIILG